MNWEQTVSMWVGRVVILVGGFATFLSFLGIVAGVILQQTKALALFAEFIWHKNDEKERAKWNKSKSE